MPKKNGKALSSLKAIDHKPVTRSTNSQKRCLEIDNILFTESDDEKIKRAVGSYIMQGQIIKRGQIPWKKIATNLTGSASGKQTRERYCNYLDPTVYKGEWTINEDQLLLRLHDELGNQWSTISRSLGTNRTAHSVKNHFIKINRKKKATAIVSCIRSEKVKSKATSSNEISKHIERTMSPDAYNSGYCNGNRCSKRVKHSSESDMAASVAERDRVEQEKEQEQSKQIILMRDCHDPFLSSPNPNPNLNPHSLDVPILSELPIWSSSSRSSEGVELVAGMMCLPDEIPTPRLTQEVEVIDETLLSNLWNTS